MVKLWGSKEETLNVMVGQLYFILRYVLLCCSETFFLFCLCTSQIEASTSSPRATPWAFEFLENFCSNSPLTGPKSCSNAPTPGKITRLLF